MAEDALGSLDGGLQDPETTPNGAPQGPTFAPVSPQPYNQATMTCLRGPCVHFWRLVLRFESAVEDVMTERNWTCLASRSEEFALNDKHVYFCNRWWPCAPLRDDDGEVLITVPRTFMDERWLDRPHLHRQWEEVLVKMGYDFSWRNFDPKANADDAPERRAFCAPGTLETVEEGAAAADAATLPPAASIPEDDDE